LINLNIQGAPAPFRLLFPPETTPAVMCSTTATLNSLDTTFAMEKDTVEVTDGAFDVSGLPDARTLQR